MAEITSITPQLKDKERCNIYVDGRFYCGLRLETAVRCRLRVGTTSPKRGMFPPCATMCWKSCAATAL